MTPVRVRFAPSPTGFLHVGGARTAIFNWLFCRHHGGTFVLRVEDTDAARSSPELTQTILDGMAWLGLSADEGPFFQSEAGERHRKDARRLIDGGEAYRCFCSAEAIKAAREEGVEAGRGYAYPGTCRDLSAEEAQRRASSGETFAVRFRVPEGRVEWDDLVHRTTGFDSRTIEDFVILRSDGSPTYMLSVVSDDVAMEMTHVIRGDDHISNTPKQILLYRALGQATPRFAHLPLILGEDRKRLSKRHGAVSVLDYREQGYLPQAMFNFLALLGWSPGDDREVMSREALIDRFDLGGVGKSGAVFDLKKLDWINGEYLAAMPVEKLAQQLRPRLEAAGLWRETFEREERELLYKSLALLQGRARRLGDFVEFGRPYLDLSDEFPYDAKADKKHLKGEHLTRQMQALTQRLGQVDRWEVQPLEEALREVAEQHEVSAGRLIHPTRLAVTGLAVSPGIFEVLETLGRDRCLRRLERLIAHLEDR